MTNESIACNLNTVFRAFDFQKENNLIAYSSANLVCILDQWHIKGKYPKVLFTLNGHSERVNAVRWISHDILISISVDKSIIIWTYIDDPKVHNNWKIAQRIENAHNQSINQLTVLSLNENELYFATMCMGGTLKFW